MAKNKKQTVFISGIAGFLGSHLAEYMIAEGHKVVGCDSLIGGYLDNVPPEADFYQYDCNFHNSMVKITKGVDTVFHAAATAYEGLSVFSPYLITKNIVDPTVSLVTAAIANNCKRFVYCSSMARYGTNAVPFTEDMTPQPQDPYGIAKVCGEQMVRNLCGVHGMEYVIAVPHNIIGPRQKYDDPYRNVASIMINLMLQGRQPIIYGTGEQKRCFSDVNDVLWCLEQIAFREDVVGETFNIGPDEEFVTINELAEIISNLLQFNLNPTYLPDRPQEVMLANCSADKARARLGFTTSTSLRDSLAAMIDHIREKKPKAFHYHLDLEIINDKTPKSWFEKLF